MKVSDWEEVNDQDTDSNINVVECEESLCAVFYNVYWYIKVFSYLLVNDAKIISIKQI